MNFTEALRKTREEYLRPKEPVDFTEALRKSREQAAKPGIMPSPYVTPGAYEEEMARRYPEDIPPPRYPQVATTTTPPLLPVAKVAKRAFKPVAIALNVVTAAEVNLLANALEVPMEGDPRLHGWGDLFVAVAKQNAPQLEAAKQMGLGMIAEAAKKPWYSPQAYAQIAGGTKLAEMTTTAMSPAAMYLYGFVLDVFSPADPINWINPARVKSVGKLGRLPAFEDVYNAKFQEWLEKLPAKLSNEKLGTIENQMTLFGKVIFTPGGTLPDATKAVNDLMGRDMRTLEKGFDNTLQAAYTLTQAVKKADPAKYDQLLKGVGKELEEMGLRSDTARKWYVTVAYPFTPDEHLLLKEGIEEGSRLRKVGQVIAGQRAIKLPGLRRQYRLLPEYTTMMEYGVGEVGKYGTDIGQQAKTIVMQADPEVLTHVKTVIKTVQGKVEKRKVLNDYLDLGIRIQKQLDSGVNLADAVATEASNNLATSIKKKVAQLDKRAAAGKTIPKDLQAAGMMREGEVEKVERKLPRAQLLVQAEQQIQSAKIVGDTAGVQTITKKWGKFISQYDDALELFRDKLDRTIRTVDNDRKVILNVADVSPIDKDGNILKSIEDAEGAKWAPTKLLVRNADGSVNYVTDIRKIGEYVKALDEGKITQAQAFRRKWESPVAKAGMEEPTVMPEEATAGAPPTPPAPTPSLAQVTPTPTPAPTPVPTQGMTFKGTVAPISIRFTPTPAPQITPAVNLDVRFPLAPDTIRTLKSVSEDPEVANLVQHLGIKNIVVDLPTTFELSQMGGVTKEGIIRLNPNAPNISETLMHELAEVAYQNMDTAQKDAVTQLVNENIDKVGIGYAELARSGDPREAFADLIGQKNSSAIQLAMQTQPGVFGRETVIPPVKEVPVKAQTVRSWDDIRKAGGYITSDDDLQEIVKQYGERTIILKDVNGGRHAMPASVADKALEKPLVAGHIREVFLPTQEVEEKIIIDNYTLNTLPNLARGFEDIPEIKKALPEAPKVTAEGVKAEAKEITQPQTVRTLTVELLKEYPKKGRVAQVSSNAGYDSGSILLESALSELDEGQPLALTKDEIVDMMLDEIKLAKEENPKLSEDSFQIGFLQGMRDAYGDVAISVPKSEITQPGAIGEAEGVAGAGDWVKDAIDRGLWDNANELKDYAIDVEFDSRKQRPSFREVMEKDITLIRNRITELETGGAERGAVELADSVIEPAVEVGAKAEVPEGAYKIEEDILGIKKDKMGRVIAREEGERITEAISEGKPISDEMLLAVEARIQRIREATTTTDEVYKLADEVNRILDEAGEIAPAESQRLRGQTTEAVMDRLAGVPKVPQGERPEAAARAIDYKASPVFDTLPASIQKKFTTGSMGIEQVGEKFKVWGLTQKGNRKYLPAEFDNVGEAVALSQVTNKDAANVVAKIKVAKTVDELTTAYDVDVYDAVFKRSRKGAELLEDVHRKQLAKLAESDKVAEISLSQQAKYDDKAKELLADIIKKRATALPAIGAAPLAFEQDNEDEGGMSLWEKAVLYSFFTGALATGTLAGYKYFKSRGLRITREGIKAIDAAEVASRIAEQTRTEMMRLGEAREELLRLDRQAELLREHGQGIARPFYVGDPAVKATENTFSSRLGISAKTMVKFRQAFTQAIPQEFQTAYQDIMYRARWLGVHADRVSRQLLGDVNLLAETEKIGKKELADALTQEAARNMISYDKNELATIRKLYEGKLIIPYRQIRNDTVGRQMQALQENFGRFVNVDEVNKQVDILNQTLPDTEKLTPIVVTAGEPMTTDQLKTAAEVANWQMKNTLANVADLFDTGIEELPIIKNLSPQGRASALNIAAQLSSLYEFTRAMDDIKRKPFGFLTDWLDEERLTYAYHTMTKEARDRYWTLHEGQELPYIGGVVVRKHPIVNAHDTIRKLFPSYSIHEINRLGRASTDANIIDLAMNIDTPTDNPLGRLAVDMGVSADTILHNAMAFTHNFGGPLRQTLVDDPSWLVGVRMSATKSIARTGDLIRDTMKFGLPKSLVAPTGTPTGAYQSWAPLSITEKIEDPILSKMFEHLYFPPEIKQMVDRALTNYRSPFKRYRRPDQQRGLLWSTWNVLDHLLNLMKTQALGTLGYVQMNLISALWQNWMEDVSPDAYVAMIRYGTTKRLPEGVEYGTKGGKYSAREFDEGLSAVAMSGFINSELRKPTALSSKFTKTVYKAFAEDIAIGQPLPPGATNWLSQGTETYVRGAHMIDKLQKGYSLNDAIRSALHAQYDYATDTYGDLFQYSFKVFPFLKWQINNIPYTFVKLFTQPRKVRMEAFNVPKLGWQMLEPTLPEDVNTDLQYSPKYRVDRMPIPIATYTTDSGRKHAVMWGLARQFPHLEPLALAPNIYTDEWRKDVWTWLLEEKGPEVGREILGQARPEIGLIYSAITAIGGGPAREVTGRPIDIPKKDPHLRVLEHVALRVIPVQRLFRIMEVGGLELKHLRPIVNPTTYDALRKNPDMSKIGLLLGSGNLYVYDVSKEKYAMAVAAERARGEMMSELFKMGLRGETPKAIREEAEAEAKYIKRFYKQLTGEASQNFAEVQTKGGK